MCDCPQHLADDKIVGKIDPETVTLFSKCFTSYRPGKDILEYKIPSDSNCTSIDSVQSNSSDTTCDFAKKSLSSLESSSESSRSYIFIPTECDYSGGEESFKSPAVCFHSDKIEKTVKKGSEVEYTLAIIKPEAVVYRTEIEHRIYTEGFEICQTRWLQLTPEQVSEFYNNHFGELSFPHLVAYMSSGPILVFVLAKQNAVEEWKKIMGPATITEARLYFPDSIRARYGRRGDGFKNAVHGSNNREQAEKEIHFFFPKFIIEPLLRDEMVEDYLWENINPILVEGLTLCCKHRPADPVLWLAHWLILNNPNKPKLPENLALIPT
ncbi:nucleoside diphosphate kinase homolog 5 [Polyergus mexicanus]|uniref:nucleoside diphosphate kinase homolog 5 n=1 Tax=Polyergus mexicanus TaxID=615972 RepID=UPI0038B46467